MSEKTICEKCGHEMSYFMDVSTCGMTCTNCGWGWVTTYIEPIRLDKTVYVLTISPIITPSTDTLRCISQLLMCNYLQAKEKLNNEIVLTDKAVKIQEIATELSKHHISYFITPDFPYNIIDNSSKK